MKRPTKTVTSIGVVAFVIAAAITGPRARRRLVRLRPPRPAVHRHLPGVFLLGYLLDRAARNAV